MSDQWVDADGTERLRGTFVSGAPLLAVVPFTFEDVNSDGGGNGSLLVATLTAGDVWLAGLVEITEAFDDSDASGFTLVASKTADPQTSVALTSEVAYDTVIAATSSGMLGSLQSSQAFSHASKAIEFGVVQTDQTVSVYVAGPYEGDGATGAAIAYLLIARAP